MKKIYISAVALCMATVAAAQSDYRTPTIMEDAFAIKISGNGEYIVAQDIFGATHIYNTTTGDVKDYDVYYPGDGNCIADNGTAVGQSIDGSVAVVLRNGRASAFTNLGMSSLNAITSDGLRACGYMTRDDGAMQVPFYCDIAENGLIGKAVPLPYPDKDFFGDRPQYVSAVCISEDGKTISGMVTDATGFFSYPIIFRQDENGSWTYATPTEKLFNPDNIPVPTFPKDDMGTAPQVYEFMTPDKRKEFIEAYEKYLETDNSADNPMNDLSYYMTETDLQDYNDAIEAYRKKQLEYYAEIDEYWIKMNSIGRYQRFGGMMSISPDGNLMAVSLGITGSESATDIYDSFEPYLFDTVSGSFQRIDTSVSNLLVSQIMGDGTLVAVTAPTAFFTYNAYIWTPDSDDFMAFTDYIETYNPDIFPWMEDNLGQDGIIGYDPETAEPIYGFYITTGMISFDADMTTFAGGIPSGNFFSYYYKDVPNGVEEIVPETEETVFEVFDINGFRILTTSEKERIYNLPKGIYIVNGKKIIL